VGALIAPNGGIPNPARRVLERAGFAMVRFGAPALPACPPGATPCWRVFDGPRFGTGRAARRSWQGSSVSINDPALHRSPRSRIISRPRQAYRDGRKKIPLATGRIHTWLLKSLSRRRESAEVTSIPRTGGGTWQDDARALATRNRIASSRGNSPCQKPSSLRYSKTRSN
jgi:hypothetical protein